MYKRRREKHRVKDKHTHQHSKLAPIPGTNS